jgi:hypothetical protein
MSEIRANSITDAAGTGAPNFPNGLEVGGTPLVSGTKTFTATGELSTGDLVGLNADGTVSVVTPYYGSETVFESATTIEISAAYDPVNAKVVIVYADNGNSNYKTAVVGTVSGTSISFGTPVVFFSAATGFTGTACVFNTTGSKVVIVYTDSNGWGYAVVGTVSGTTISFGSSAIFRASFVLSLSMAYDSANNKVVISYCDLFNSSFGTAVVGTVSGTSISFGTPVVFNSADTPRTSCVYATTSGKIVIAYTDNGNSSFGTAKVGTVSGTSISFGSAVVFQSSNTRINVRGVVYDSTADKVVITYANYGVSPATAIAVVGTVSGTSISFGTPVTFYSNAPNAVNDLCCCFNPTTGDITVLLQRGVSSVYWNAFTRLRVSGTTVLTGTVLNQTYNTAWPVIVTAGSVSVAAYQARQNSDFGTAQVVNMSSTLPTWVGVAAESISTGNDGVVTVVGGIASGLSALTTGEIYGIPNSTGALTATTTNRIGIAISPTELYINTGRV